MKVKQVEKMVRACMNQLKKKEYELGITKADVDAAVRVLQVIDKNGVPGGGGGAIIKINMSYWQHSNEPHTFTEYESYNEDPVIGKHEVQNFEHCVWLQVAHEVSHHVQYAICPHIKRFSRRGSKSYLKPHGDGFKTIYRFLRRDFINPLIDTNDSYFHHWFSREDLPKPEVKKKKLTKEQKENNSYRAKSKKLLKTWNSLWREKYNYDIYIEHGLQHGMSGGEFNFELALYSGYNEDSEDYSYDLRDHAHSWKEAYVWIGEEMKEIMEVL
tara:strand:- start:45 stop:857 length:813 start_codon:yes stop_codon:yes gene_type:complete